MTKGIKTILVCMSLLSAYSMHGRKNVQGYNPVATPRYKAMTGDVTVEVTQLNKKQCKEHGLRTRILKKHTPIHIKITNNTDSAYVIGKKTIDLEIPEHDLIGTYLRKKRFSSFSRFIQWFSRINLLISGPLLILLGGGVLILGLAGASFFTAYTALTGVASIALGAGSCYFMYSGLADTLPFGVLPLLGFGLGPFSAIPLIENGVKTHRYNEKIKANEQFIGHGAIVQPGTSAEFFTCTKKRDFQDIFDITLKSSDDDPFEDLVFNVHLQRTDVLQAF